VLLLETGAMRIELTGMTMEAGDVMIGLIAMLAGGSGTPVLGHATTAATAATTLGNVPTPAETVVPVAAYDFDNTAMDDVGLAGGSTGAAVGMVARAVVWETTGELCVGGLANFGLDFVEEFGVDVSTPEVETGDEVMASFGWTWSCPTGCAVWATGGATSNRNKEIVKHRFHCLQINTGQTAG
jgi:hypothetical protein